VQAVGVDHRINALGYVLQEEERPGKFHLEKARALGVPSGPCSASSSGASRCSCRTGARCGRRRSWESHGPGGASSSPGTPGRASPWCARRGTRTCSSTSPPSPTTSRRGRRRRGTPPRERRAAWPTRPRPAPHPHPPLQPSRHGPLQAAGTGPRGVPRARGGGP
jgi:hypothetical protein